MLAVHSKGTRFQLVYTEHTCSSDEQWVCDVLVVGELLQYYCLKMKIIIIKKLTMLADDRENPRKA